MRALWKIESKSCTTAADSRLELSVSCAPRIITLFFVSEIILPTILYNVLVFDKKSRKEMTK